MWSLGELLLCGLVWSCWLIENLEKLLKFQLKIWKKELIQIWISISKWKFLEKIKDLKENLCLKIRTIKFEFKSAVKINKFFLFSIFNLIYFIFITRQWYNNSHNFSHSPFSRSLTLFFINISVTHFFLFFKNLNFSTTIIMLRVCVCVAWFKEIQFRWFNEQSKLFLLQIKVISLCIHEKSWLRNEFKEWTVSRKIV
jgi:hypothetical protein